MRVHRGQKHFLNILLGIIDIYFLTQILKNMFLAPVCVSDCATEKERGKMHDTNTDTVNYVRVHYVIEYQYQ